MQLSGDYLLSIPYQSGIGARFDCVFGSGIYQFGFTGSSGIVDFYVSGSKIFDSARNFIYSDPYQSPVNLEVFSNSSVASFYANGELLSYSTGNYSPLTGFFSKSNEYYENTFSISGDLPVLQYTGLVNFGSGVDMMVGALINSTPFRKFKIANILLLEDSAPQTYIYGWQTGEISNTGKIYITSSLPEAERTGILKTKIHTNFGVLDLDINLQTNAADTIQKLALWPIDPYFKEYQSKGYILETEHNFGSRVLDIRLEHVSGGHLYPYYAPATGIGTGYYTGNVVRYGDVTGAISGYLQYGVYQTGAVSKYYIITGLKTGNATGAYLTGLYSGFLISQTNVLSGYSRTFTSGDSGYHYWGVGTGSITGIYPHVTGSGDVLFTKSGSASNWSGGAINNTTGIVTGNGILYKIKYGYDLEEFESVFTQITNENTNDTFYWYNSSGDGYYSGQTGTHRIWTGHDVGYGFNTSGHLTFINDSTGSFISLEIFPEIWENSTVTLTGTGNFGSVELSTGYYETFTGAMTGEALVTTGVVPFTGMWDLYTGRYYPNILSFRDHGWGNSTGYFNTGTTIYLPKENKTTIIDISYDGRETSGVNIARLRYSDGYESGQLLISGVGKTF